MHSPEQIYSNVTLNEILLELSTSLSMVGCLLIIITYFLYNDIRTPSRHIIFCISIAYFVGAFVNFLVKFADMPDSKIAKDICVIRSFVGSMATLWSFFWTVALAIFLNILIVQKDPGLADKLIHKFFHPICWVVPIFINLLALFLRKLGNSYDFVASGWCWIKLDINGKEKLQYVNNVTGNSSSLKK